MHVHVFGFVGFDVSIGERCGGDRRQRSADHTITGDYWLLERRFERSKAIQLNLIMSEYLCQRRRAGVCLL